MSYDVSLRKNLGHPESLPFNRTFQEGGTQEIGGTDRCYLNITYNYSEVFGSLVRDLDGKTAEETLPRLKEFLAKWPENIRPYTRDYWAPTPGNAVAAIKLLVEFAELHPYGVWEVR